MSEQIRRRNRISTYNAVETAIERTKSNSHETWEALLKKKPAVNLERPECPECDKDSKTQQSSTDERA